MFVLTEKFGQLSTVLFRYLIPCVYLGFCSFLTQENLPLHLPQDKILSKSVDESSEELMAVKKGNMVRAVREKLENSVEAKASDTRFPSYLFDSPGEIVDIKGDYALVKFGKVPTPNIWLKLEQLEEFA